MSSDLERANYALRNIIDMKEAAIAKLRAQLAEQTDGLVCACGCPWDEHEVVDDEGYNCEHDDHECIQCWPAVLVMLESLRAALAKKGGA